MKKTIKIMEYYSGVRTYKVEAKDVDEAISMIQECNVEPIDDEIQHSEFEVE